MVVQVVQCALPTTNRKPVLQGVVFSGILFFLKHDKRTGFKTKPLE
jgi:hypothetical protein